MFSTPLLLSVLSAFGPQQQAREVHTDRGVRIERPKPAHYALKSWQSHAYIRVKFHDDLIVRERDGALVDFGTGALDGARDALERWSTGTWRRGHDVSEERLDELRANAIQNLGHHVADLNTQFDLVLPQDADPTRAIDDFNALECVELADAAPLPIDPPTVPDYMSLQQYIGAPPAGMGSFYMWDWHIAGGSGDSAKIADVEYSWNAAHVELQGVQTLGAPPSNAAQSQGNKDHGTAALGILKAPHDGVGISGLSHDSSVYFVASLTNAGWRVDAAITTALNTLFFGSTILLEQQWPGPFYNPPACCNTNTCAGGVDCQFGSVPVEWDVFNYNAIVTAVGNGVVVVEAAGNGSQDLDAPIYGQDNFGHWPFLGINDSGAIIVGAGRAPNGTGVDRSRMWYSDYGATVDLQAWGENVLTTGYGDLWSSDGENAWYTSRFSGTSAASAQVAGVCAQLQSMHWWGAFNYHQVADVRRILRTTGSPQLNGQYPATQSIGPRPNLAAAVMAAGDATPRFFCGGDEQPNACPCGNGSTPGSKQGCRNSTGLGGLLVAAGVPSLSNDTMNLYGQNMPPSSALYFQGTTQVNNGAGAVFGDGLRCAGGAIVRLNTVTNTTDGYSQYPRPGHPRLHEQGQVGQPGIRTYQVWYRNAAAFCMPATYNLTNGVQINWQP